MADELKATMRRLILFATVERPAEAAAETLPPEPEAGRRHS
jgi:hypothetical protein